MRSISLKYFSNLVTDVLAAFNNLTADVSVNSLYLSQAAFNLLLVLYFSLNTLLITSSSLFSSSYTANGDL